MFPVFTALTQFSLALHRWYLRKTQEDSKTELHTAEEAELRHCKHGCPPFSFEIRLIGRMIVFTDILGTIFADYEVELINFDYEEKEKSLKAQKFSFPG